MASLQLFPPNDSEPRAYPDWGTGKNLGEKENLWISKGPTWQYDGEPTEQYYQLTQLKLSNVRTNDELLPSPQHCVMHNVLSNKPFPAEHPYASHIERKAMFPKFDSASDPKRGVRAREERPKNAEMPSQPYECTIVSKSKGSGFRHEIQQLPAESMKEPLVWKEGDFDHLTKSPTKDRQSFYPWPPKTLVPNLLERSDANCIRGNMEVSERSGTALRNVERDQWETTYDRNYTGLGPTNPNQLDNYAEKRSKDGDNDALTPRTVRTFDPARPMEGRIARALTPPPPPQTDRYPETRERRTPVPQTLHEKEEKRLWHGGEYRNLPEDTGPGGKHSGLQWLESQADRHPEAGLATLNASQTALGQTSGLQAHEGGVVEGDTGESPAQALVRQQHDHFQQMEAGNRWKLLELQKPSDDITALKHKMALASDKTQPFVFYGHEGKFQGERAGLYKTTYDPYSLQYSMNKRERSGDGIFDITDVHKNALDHPLPINQEMHAAMRLNRTLGGPPGSVPQLHAQPSQFEAIGPFDREKAAQKAHLQPHLSAAGVRTQEGELVLRESTMGESYNTRKFLQENQLPFYSRNEPNILMSHENQDLNRVRLTAIPNPGAGAPGTPGGLNTALPRLAPVGLLGLARPISAPEASTGAPALSERYSYQWQMPPAEVTQSAVFRGGSSSSLGANPRAAKRLSRQTAASDQFASKSTNFMPSDFSWAPESKYEFEHAAAKQGGGATVDMTFKNEPRFSWQAGSGTPRPQSTLLGIQDCFTKSETRQRFRDQFPENLPDLRENTTRGRKHEFDSMNAQVLRGTTLVEVV